MTMKKVHFVAWLWAVSFWGWSQPTLLTETTSLVAGSSACLEDLLELEIEVLNETGSTMNLYVTRTLLDTVSPFNYPYVSGNEGAQERFCWGPTCFQYGTDVSPLNPMFLVTLEPGESTSTFRADYFHNGVVGESTFRYCFVPTENPLDATCQNLTFGMVEANPALGCTDPSAWNFDPEACEDDGSCAQADYSCSGAGGLWWDGVPTGVGWPATTWTAGIANNDFGVMHVGPTMSVDGQEIEVLGWSIAGSSGLPAGLTMDWDVDEALAPSQACFHVSGATSAVGTFSVVLLLDVQTTVFGIDLDLEAVPFEFELQVVPNPCGEVGCTLPVAVNFNPNAVLDDGTCFLAGCTDPEALNYHPAFSFEDGTCLYDSDIGPSCPMDGDSDGVIGVGDLLVLLTMFGTNCSL